MKKILPLLLVLILTVPAFCQDSTEIYQKRKKIVLGGGAVIYTGTLYFLYQAWYKDYDQSAFHFYNDNSNWMLMDKCGHALTSYQLSRIGYHTAQWAGYSKNKSIWIGGATGFIFQTIIETLDGFSEEWGASPGDLIANTVGSALFISQQKLWDEQRFMMKISYHGTKHAQYRPDLLGSNSAERILKNYNGQTSWLSANIKSFSTKSAFPAWLDIAIGYNAYGMTGASSNAIEYKGVAIPTFRRTQRFFLAPDVRWQNIQTHSKALKLLFNALSFVKCPTPALEYNEFEGFKLHLIFF